MVNRWVRSLSVVPLVFAAGAAHAAAPAKQPTTARPAPTKATTPAKAATPRKARSKERIHTYTPRPEKAGAASGEIRPSRVVMASSDDPFVGFSPIDNGVVGVGLWRVPKVERNDPNRSQPLRDQRGKTGKAAAVGFQLSF